MNFLEHIEINILANCMLKQTSTVHKKYHHNYVYIILDSHRFNYIGLVCLIANNHDDFTEMKLAKQRNIQIMKHRNIYKNECKEYRSKQPNRCIALMANVDKKSVFFKFFKRKK